MNEKELKLYRNDYDWIVAYDTEDAWDIWTKFSGEKREEYDIGDLSWKEIPKDKELCVFDEDIGDSERGTAQQFIEEYGRGFLMSTEW